MLPTRLNIISQSKKKFIEKMIFMQFSRALIEVFLFVMCLASITLVGAWWVLQSHFNALATQLTYRSYQQTERSLQIKQVNDLLADLDKLQRAHTPWSMRVAEIADKVPSGVVLSSLDLDSLNNTYTFVGKAALRADLLLFKERLESLPFIDLIDLPITQLTQREDLQFTMTASVL